MSDDPASLSSTTDHPTILRILCDIHEHQRQLHDRLTTLEGRIYAMESAFPQPADNGEVAEARGTDESAKQSDSPHRGHAAKSATRRRVAPEILNAVTTRWHKMKRALKPAELKKSPEPSTPTEASRVPPPPCVKDEPSKPRSYKTALCRQWTAADSCEYGVSCKFAHGEEELRSVGRHLDEEENKAEAGTNGIDRRHRSSRRRGTGSRQGRRDGGGVESVAAGE
jgi:Zinc finger C-x8-C-x5-C-x3-H type (and similar)